MGMGKTILALSAEDSGLEQAWALLRGLGHRLYVAGDRAESLRLAGELAELDLVICDGLLAQGEAPALIRAFRQGRGERVGVILLVAREDAGGAPNEELKGVDFFLCKPFTAEALLNAVGYCLARPRFPLWAVAPPPGRPRGERSSAKPPSGVYAMPPPPASTLPGLSGSRNVLILDDDEDSRHVLGKVLELRGYTHQGAKNAFEAMDLIKGGAQFGLILLDQCMPGKTGLDFLGWMRSRPEPPIPVVMISAHSNGTVIQRAYSAGVELILPKPVSVDSLDAVLAYCFGEHTPEDRALLRKKLAQMADSMA